jgi:hypothetical protein
MTSNTADRPTNADEFHQWYLAVIDVPKGRGDVAVLDTASGIAGFITGTHSTGSLPSRCLSVNVEFKKGYGARTEDVTIATERLFTERYRFMASYPQWRDGRERGESEAQAHARHLATARDAMKEAGK